jgi:hypothetical protein
MQLAVAEINSKLDSGSSFILKRIKLPHVNEQPSTEVTE